MPKPRAGKPPSMTRTGAAAEQIDLRLERDRFLAFAFCWADLMIELDPNHKVVFIAGATQSLLGSSVDQLRDAPFFSLVAAKSRARALEMLVEMTEGGRPEPTTISLKGNAARTVPLYVTGYCVAELQNHCFLSLKIAWSVYDVKGAPAPEDLEEPPLQDGRSFGRLAAGLLRAGHEDSAAHQLTLLQLDDLPDLLERMDSAAQDELKTVIGAHLNKNSVHGNSAAQLGENRYGIIHAATLDGTELGAEIAAETRRADPSGIGVAVRDATLALSMADMEEKEAVSALKCVLRRWSRDHEEALNLSDLSNGLPALVEQVRTDVIRVETVIRNKAFSTVYQPIVDLRTREPHHFEVLARIDGEAGSPFHFITLAEDLGLIREFDLAICRSTIDWLVSRNKKGQRYSLAVNLSAQSLGNQGFVSTLRNELSSDIQDQGQLLFEVTESERIGDLEAMNKTIQALRARGHKVCLDDFGVGETSLQQLRQLQVDIVKIDGSYVREALTDATSRHILKAIVKLCRKLKVETVAEMIEDEETVAFLRDCGVDYGQGYLFGRPSSDIESFLSPSEELVLRGGGIIETVSR